MTALEKYQRLECTGLWRETDDAQRREVVVSFGNATVVLSDFAGRPLAHWSLPAIVRTDDIDDAAVYRPGQDSSETLELSETEMVQALDEVRAALNRRAPKPGRLRLVLWGGVAGLLVVTSLVWLPNAVYRYGSEILPDVKQTELGEQIAMNIGRAHGGFCSNPEGQAALTRMARDLLDDDQARALTVRQVLRHPVILPGNILITGQNHIDQYAEADAFAGELLRLQLAGLKDNTLKSSLRTAGMWPTLMLLSRGTLSAKAVNTVARSAIKNPLVDVSQQALQNAFAAHELSTTAYANSLGPQPLRQWLLDNDPYPAGSPAPVLPDGAWLSLKAICADF